MAEDDDFKRTIVYGESAISYIKRNSLPAYPKSYELWYTYSSGYNHGLNRAINEILRHKGSISSEDMQQLYAKYLSPTRLGDRLSDVGSKVSKEVEGLIETLAHSVDAASEYGTSLRKAASILPELNEPKKVEAFISVMLHATREAVLANNTLEAQLLESKRQFEALQSNLEAIRYESLTDELTTLGNRKHFDTALEQCLAQAQHTAEPLCLLLTDIDHFKRFNDTYGHQTGDQVLRLVALTTKQSVKSHDVPCRYGGEEFAIILPRSDLVAARNVAEKIRSSVMSKELLKRSTGENLGRVTVSIGISIYSRGDTAHSIVARADEALYTAKRNGRNLVVTEKDLRERTEVA
ncbi:GGDEF domain-containing protein [Roseibium litorale]|uniref:diguanylate cyclase n=1 Tax=Roseibium litorale TaxID=2803841 RepID=A0ABR9CTU3_9HYPH|nr:GGDEF domain-containing protein [Roseibium litorale]MBD8894168.1 GGDEF domain-containing protein [Roseibium litorale]